VSPSPSSVRSLSAAGPRWRWDEASLGEPAILCPDEDLRLSDRARVWPVARGVLDDLGLQGSEHAEGDWSFGDPPADRAGAARCALGLESAVLWRVGPYVATGCEGAGAVAEAPETRYLRVADGTFIAYQAVGDGPVDLVFGLNSDGSNVDLIWEEPDWRLFLSGALEFGRVIVHDRRGLGVSSRNVALPTLETQVSDLVAVLDAVDADNPILVGSSESGAMHAVFAATHPDRVSGMLWNNPRGRMAWAPDYPWGRGREEFEQDMRDALAWGTAEYGRAVAHWREAERRGVPSGDAAFDVASTSEFVNAYARINRNTATPDVAERIMQIYWETDVRAVLPSVRTRTIVVTGTRDDVAEAEYVASLMPNATLRVIEGRSGVAVDPITGFLREMAGVAPVPVGLDTVLATVLFTDIVGSTARQAALGDKKWKDLIEAHHALVRASLTRWHGVEIDTAGDSFYATFDGPARAIRCALEIVEGVRALGIEIRAGVHTGECEVIDGKQAGLAVTIGARVSNAAGPSEVLVSQTVKDLVAGSGLTFGEPSARQLKGVPGTWQLSPVRDT